MSKLRKVIDLPDFVVYTGDEIKQEIVAVNSMTELCNKYEIKCPKLLSSMEFSDSNYERNFSSGLELNKDTFLEGCQPRETQKVLLPIVRHILLHLLNKKAIEKKHSTKLNLQAKANSVTVKEPVLSEKQHRKKQKISRSQSAPVTQASGVTSLSDALENEDVYMDQGFTRGKILIVCPFRHSVVTLVSLIVNLLNGECNVGFDELEVLANQEGATSISNLQKFIDEFTYMDEEEDAGKPCNKPMDWQELFHEKNIDDDFKIGIQVNPEHGNKLKDVSVDDDDEVSISLSDNAVSVKISKGKGCNVRLFSEFYQSDIIICSPLGMRLHLEGSVKEDADGIPSEELPPADFLSSIETVVVHQADVLLMQNWDHVEYVLKCTNQMPRNSSTEIDYSRVKKLFLEGKAREHRQMIVTSLFNDPAIQSFFRTNSLNNNGVLRARIRNQEAGSGVLSEVVCGVNQLFQLIPCDELDEEEDKRFQYFKDYVLTPMIRSNQSHTLIVAPSYLHYVRIRNELIRREANCAFVCEYSRDSEISRGRSRFLHGQVDILLYSGRSHFFRRFKIRGALHIVFYSVPEICSFYPELVNMLENPETIAKIEEKRRSEKAAAEVEEVVEEPVAKKPVHGKKEWFTSVHGENKQSKKFSKKTAAPEVQSAPEVVIRSNSCAVLFTKFEKMALERVVGAKKCDHMLNSGKTTFIYK